MHDASADMTSNADPSTTTQTRANKRKLASVVDDAISSPRINSALAAVDMNDSKYRATIDDMEEMKENAKDVRQCCSVAFQWLRRRAHEFGVTSLKTCGCERLLLQLILLAEQELHSWLADKVLSPSEASTTVPVPEQTSDNERAIITAVEISLERLLALSSQYWFCRMLLGCRSLLAVFAVFSTCSDDRLQVSMFSNTVVSCVCLWGVWSTKRHIIFSNHLYLFVNRKSA